MDLLLLQYELVKSSRAVVFEFCDRFSGSDFSKELPHSGKGSIRNLYTHIANTYIFWTGNFALKKELPYFHTETLQSVKHIRNAFDMVNTVIADFLSQFKTSPNFPLTAPSYDKKQLVTSTPLMLFTHVITHEFHHKGQIMLLSKSMGYIPPDADLIRF